MNIDTIINKKESNELLTYDEIDYMINLYINEKINDEVMSKFIFSIYNNSLSQTEINYLTDIMIKSGEVIDLSSIKKPVVDKHSSGGIGDKTTLIVSPIVASLGVVVPKMSGRGLGITGGTADKLESIPGYRINISKKDFLNMLNSVGVSVITQSEKIAIADKKIYALRNEIGAVDSIPLIASSIMSKKIASGANNIVIDLKVGSGAFMKNIKDASKLAKTMVNIGKNYNKRVVCSLTDMDSPLGRYIGNALEVKETIDFFDGIYDKRLYNLCVYISSLMISVSKNITFKKAKEEVVETLKNGKAKQKFYEWIKAQGGNLSKFKINAKKYLVVAKTNGYVNSINAEKLGKLVFELGGGRCKKTDTIDYNCGFVINKELGSKVKKGEVLGIIYYNKEIVNMENQVIDAFNIGKRKKRIHNIIIKTIK